MTDQASCNQGQIKPKVLQI